MNQDTPLRTRIRASVAMAAGATLLVGVYLYMGRDVAAAERRAAWLEVHAAQLETEGLRQDAAGLETAGGLK